MNRTCVVILGIYCTMTQTDGAVIAYDGKTVRRSHDHDAGKAAVHMVSARASAANLVVVRQERTAKVGIKTKWLKAGWDERCLLKVIAGAMRLPWENRKEAKENTKGAKE